MTSFTHDALWLLLSAPIANPIPLSAPSIAGTVDLSPSSRQIEGSADISTAPLASAVTPPFLIDADDAPIGIRSRLNGLPVGVSNSGSFIGARLAGERS